MNGLRRIGGPVSAIERQGDGLPMVFLHGVGSAPGSFRPLMAALPADARLLAWDMPGYGESAPLAEDWPDADDYAAALLALLDAAGIDRCILVGHSLGVVTATRFARRHPGRLAAMMLMSPALGYGAAPGGALPAGVQARLDDFATLGAADMAEKRAARLVFEPQARPQVLEAVRHAMAQLREPGYTQANRLLACADVCADAALLTTPTLVATGAEDVITPPANAVRLAAALQTAGCLLGHHVLPGAGHAMPQEQPDEIATLLGTLAR